MRYLKDGSGDEKIRCDEGCDNIQSDQRDRTGCRKLAEFAVMSPVDGPHTAGYFCAKHLVENIPVNIGGQFSVRVWRL